LDWVHHAIGGAGHLRFIVQPLVAILLGIRDGREDARLGRPPYIWGLVRQRESRRERLKAGLEAASKPLVLAVVFDLILQFAALRTVHIVWALVVGTFLVAIPYMLARAASNRVVTWWRRRSEVIPVGR